MKINLLDKFKLIKNQNLSIDDKEVITLLYLPLIDKKAYALYMLFDVLSKTKKESKEYLHKKIFDILDIDQKEFKYIKEHLEAFGLIETFVKNNEYIYNVKPPLSANSFLKDGFLGVYLFSQIGEEEFLNLVMEFKIEKSTRGYKNITKPFNEVFASSPKDIDFNILGKFISKEKIKPVTIMNKNIKLESLSKKLDVKLTKKSFDLITRNMYAFEIDEDEIVNIYFNSLTNNKLDSIKLSKNSHNYFKIKNNRSPRLNDTSKNKPVLNYEDKMIELLNNIDSYELLKVKYEFLTESDKIKIKKLKEFTNFNKGVLNTLLLYIIELKEELPPYNYIQIIASEWMKKGISTVEEAIAFITIKNERHTGMVKKINNKPRYNNYTKNETKPSWFDDYINEIDKE